MIRNFDTARVFVASILLAFFAQATTARADSTASEFVYDQSGRATDSVGRIELNLNDDGTIAALLSTPVGTTISNFGINSNGIYAQTGFSQKVFVTGIIAYQGVFETGFGCGCSGDISWTIGKPGDFASVLDVLSNGWRFDFMLYLVDPMVNPAPLQYYGNAGELTAAVPESSTFALLLAGLCIVGFLARRNSTTGTTPRDIYKLA